MGIELANLTKILETLEQINTKNKGDFEFAFFSGQCG